MWRRSTNARRATALSLPILMNRNGWAQKSVRQVSRTSPSKIQAIPGPSRAKQSKANRLRWPDSTSPNRKSVAWDPHRTRTLRVRPAKWQLKRVASKWKAVASPHSKPALENISTVQRLDKILHMTTSEDLEFAILTPPATLLLLLRSRCWRRTERALSANGTPKN